MLTKLKALMSNLKRQVVFAAMLAGMVAPAYAQKVIAAPGMGSPNSAWTIYAFGNAQAVADAMRALTNFTSSAIFQSLVAMIAILGVLAVGASSGFSGAVAKKFIGYAVAVLLVVYVFFGVGSGGPLVVNVEIVDTVDSTWVAPVTVPAVVGIPASMISTAGHHITRQIEASFAMPDELKMTNGAPFNLAASMIADGSRARITDPDIAGSMATYVQDCFVTAVARNEKNVATLLSSTNCLEDIRVNMPSVYVDTTLGTPKGIHNVVDCNTAHSHIVAAINALGDEPAAFMNNASAYQGTPALSVLNAGVAAAAQFASNNGVTDGGAMVKQAAVLSSFTGAFRQSAAATGNSDFLTGLAVTQAHESQKNGWIMGAEVFNRIMGYIYAVIQVFVYAVTPLILAAALIPGLGFALLKNFCQILLWLAIWQPMLAIVNFIIISMQQAELGGIMNNAGSFGYSLSNLGIVSERTATMRASSTFVGTMVPMLAWALVKGSMDFSRVISSAVGENFAAGASNTMTTGNYSLNQASMDSFTANKQSLGHTGDWGAGLSSTGQGGINTKRDLGGLMVQSGDQRAGVTNTSGLATNKGGSTGEGTNVGTTGSNVLASSSAAALAQTAGNGTSNTHANNAALGKTVGGDLGYQWKSPTAKPNANGNKGSGDGGGGNGVTGDSNNSGAPGSFANGALRTVASLLPDARVTAAGQASQQESFSNNKQNSRAENASLNTAGSETNSAQRSASDTRSANTQEGWQRSDNQQVTGMASLSDRADAMRGALEFKSRYDTDRAEEGTALHAWKHGSTPNSVGDMAASANSNATQEQAARNQQEVKSLMESQRKQTDELVEKAEREEAANRAAAEKSRKDFEDESKAADAKGHTSALGTLKNKAGDIIDSFK